LHNSKRVFGGAEAGEDRAVSESETVKGRMDMSRQIILTCNNCGSEHDKSHGNGWRDPKVFFVTETNTPYTPQIDLCPTCAKSFQDALDALGDNWAGAIIAHASRMPGEDA
jgi:hypothetical protein